MTPQYHEVPNRGNAGPSCPSAPSDMSEVFYPPDAASQPQPYSPSRVTCAFITWTPCRSNRNSRSFSFSKQRGL